MIEHVAPTPLVTKKTAPVIEDIAPAPIVMDMTMMQRTRERDAKEQAVASWLRLTWPPGKRTRRLMDLCLVRCCPSEHVACVCARPSVHANRQNRNPEGRCPVMGTRCHCRMSQWSDTAAGRATGITQTTLGPMGHHSS